MSRRVQDTKTQFAQYQHFTVVEPKPCKRRTAFVVHYDGNAQNPIRSNMRLHNAALPRRARYATVNTDAMTNWSDDLVANEIGRGMCGPCRCRRMRA